MTMVTGCVFREPVLAEAEGPGDAHLRPGIMLMKADALEEAKPWRFPNLDQHSISTGSAC